MNEKLATDQDSTSFDLPIYPIRGHRVVLDSDLARMYGVTTSRFNEAFKRSLERFPVDFAFQLSRDEAANLISQIATSSLKYVTVSQEEIHGGRRKLPWVFTEHGAVMAAIPPNPRGGAMTSTLPCVCGDRAALSPETKSYSVFSYAIRRRRISFAVALALPSTSGGQSFW
jgi:hypothetical protein